MSVEVASPPAARIVGSYHIDSGSKTLKRPRSTPAGASRPIQHVHHQHLGPNPTTPYTEYGGTPTRIHRPKTAAAVLGYTRDCDRVSQLEHEPTRRHNLDAHMPVKKNRPPPWQRSIDPPLVPFVVGPGYILSKSKSKFAVTLKDEFFDPFTDEEVKKTVIDNERDTLIAQLQERISDLSLFLEEERLNHKQTKQRSDDHLRDRIEELENSKRKAVEDKDQEGKDELEKLRSSMQSEYDKYKSTSEAQIARMKKEIEFLQGAFESYKTSLHQETDEKWRRKQEDLTNELQAQKEKEMLDMRNRMIQERNIEKAQIGKDNHRAIDNLRKEHKREMEELESNLVRKYSNVAADMERLTKCTNELNETKAELEAVKQSYNETCKQLTNLARELTDTKVRLMAFEEQFDIKVQEVDEKYKKRMEELMIQNTELKRLYVGKCGELYEEKVLFERDRVERVMTARQTMQGMLKSKHKADVNLAPGLREIEDKKRQPKMRPGSAPITKVETETAALSAGELDHLKRRQEEEVIPELMLPEDSEEIGEMRKSLMSGIKELSKEDLLNSVSDTVT